MPNWGSFAKQKRNKNRKKFLLLFSCESYECFEVMYSCIGVMYVPCLLSGVDVIAAIENNVITFATFWVQVCPCSS